MTDNSKILISIINALSLITIVAMIFIFIYSLVYSPAYKPYVETTTTQTTTTMTTQISTQEPQIEKYICTNWTESKTPVCSGFHIEYELYSTETLCDFQSLRLPVNDYKIKILNFYPDGITTNALPSSEQLLETRYSDTYRNAESDIGFNIHEMYSDWCVEFELYTPFSYTCTDRVSTGTPIMLCNQWKIENMISNEV